MASLYSSSWKPDHERAASLASTARFPEFLSVCQAALDRHPDDVEAWLSFGSLLRAFGFLTKARICFESGLRISPTDFRFLASLANSAREAGEHRKAREIYSRLRALAPGQEAVQRNALLSLEYDPDASDAERLAQARSWGEWAMARAGGMRARPAPTILRDRPLRLGYLSADFCQHPVGLLIKDVLAAHDPARISVFAYGAGRVDDRVTAAVRRASAFRDVSALDDAALAARIRADAIDVLVDLSGHTAGSRLTVFAHRPAPVQVSWLGYFSTTGLPVMDYILLDAWHAPTGTEGAFTEEVVRLPGARICYSPVPFAPETSPPPCLANGHITFGCFNNTAKLNANVFDHWAAILHETPSSRLILKWRTLQDEGLRQATWAAFAKRGVPASRIELRGASFHADLLKEYADIDIALDPFPFSGGYTSCEALWMGVPVVTWPQSRVVSRQTFAFLRAIGSDDLAGADGDAYVRVAVELAKGRERLQALRRSLRERMRGSPLCAVAGFSRQLEDTLIRLFEQTAATTR